MTDTPDTDLTAAGQLPIPAGPDGYTSGELAIPSRAEMMQILGSQSIPFRAWVAALMEAERFEDDAPEERASSIVRAILLAETSEAALAATDLKSADDLVGTEPGSRSNVLEIRGAKPLSSSYDDGPSCFAIIDARDLAEGADVMFSCGARAVQTVVMKHMWEGWTPFKAVLTRKRKPTQRGFYPLNLEGGI